MDYPRVIKLSSPKLLELETKKAAEIAEGRKISDEIEACELEMGKIDVRLQSAEKKVDIKDLEKKVRDLMGQMEKSQLYYAEEFKKIDREKYDRMKAQTDPKLREDYELVKVKKETLELERNKRGLKAQQIKDRIVPLARKLLQPEIRDEFEDFYDIRLENGEMVGQIFSHLEDFKKNFREKRKKLYLK